jgi:hypothetical protein
MIRARLLALAVALSVVVFPATGCGVAVQEEAQSLPSGALPPVAPTSTPSPTPTPTAKEATIFFVSGPGLEGVEEPISERNAYGVMAALAAGPPIERQTDLRTLLQVDPLTGEPFLTVVAQTPMGGVVLERSDAFTSLPAADQVLLVGQVVTSLDALGLTSVTITDQAGRPVPPPLPDGRVLLGPATAADYEVLVVDPPD